MFSKVFSLLPLLVSATIAAVSPHSDLVPLKPVGNVAAVEGNTPSIGDSRLYFQNSDNSISELAISNSPAKPHTTNSPGVVLVPPSEALRGTPIAATTVNGTALQEIHFYFLSPSNVLSEYFWLAGWNGGAGCTQCLTASGFVAAAGSQVLYAMSNPATAELRVGFVSAGLPGTISEAIHSPGGQWQVFQL